MLLPTIRRWLVVAAKFALSLTFVLSLAALLPTAGAHAQPAKQGPISIRSVYTTDQNQYNKTTFAPGDKINYHVDVDNTTNSTFPIDVRFQAFPNDYSPDPRLYSYDETYHVDQMPIGLSRFYNPTTLPSDAAAYYYAVRITVTPSNSSDPANDGDWGENNFTIKSPPTHFTYNGSAAAVWADTYADSANSDYSNHTQGGDLEGKGEDCTNFASNAMFNGGFPKDNQWWAYGGRYGRFSHVWAGAQNLFDYLLSTGYGQLIGGDHKDSNGNPYYLGYQKGSHPTNGLAPGDLVFFSWGNNASISHMAIQTFRKNGSDRVDAHTADRQGVFWTLEDFWKDDPGNIPDPNNVAIYTMRITYNTASAG